MQLFDTFIRNPVKVAVGVLLVALFGVISLFNMPKQLTPEVQNPVLRIDTEWPGASPHEIEREIIQEQEEQLQSVPGVIKMTSECTDSEGADHLGVCRRHGHRRRPAQGQCPPWPGRRVSG